MRRLTWRSMSAAPSGWRRRPDSVTPAAGELGQWWKTLEIRVREPYGNAIRDQWPCVLVGYAAANRCTGQGDLDLAITYGMQDARSRRSWRPGARPPAPATAEV